MAEKLLRGADVTALAVEVLLAKLKESPALDLALQAEVPLRCSRLTPMLTHKNGYQCSGLGASLEARWLAMPRAFAHLLGCPRDGHLAHLGQERQVARKACGR